MNAYPVHTIDSEHGIQACPLFRIDHFQWTCKQHPQAAGRLGYLPGKGFLVYMECLETDPRREYTAPQSPVCNDSAMEAFFAFTSVPPHNGSLYLNFEMNANGAMHAKYGEGRKNRKTLSDAFYAACNCHAEILEDRWHVTLLVPLPLISSLCKIDTFSSGDRFFCNFYKISETPEIEHYAACWPIESEVPNFHLPACFGPAVLV